MKKSGPPNNLAPSEYEAIEQAMMETARGRWFLSQFAENCRGKDSKLILEAISKLEQSVTQPKTLPEAEKIKHDLVEMSNAIERTRKEIASLKLPEDEGNTLLGATEELDAIVIATEKATHQILHAAEDIQETTWSINEDGQLDAPCARIDNDITDIYTACSFQDITGQRTQKVVQIIRYLESRINAMISIWGIDKVSDELTNNSQSQNIKLEDSRTDAHLLNGPQLDGKGLGQENIDTMLEKEVEETSEELAEANSTNNAEIIAQTVELAETIEEEVSALQNSTDSTTAEVVNDTNDTSVNTELTTETSSSEETETASLIEEQTNSETITTQQEMSEQNTSVIDQPIQEAEVSQADENNDLETSEESLIAESQDIPETSSEQIVAEAESVAEIEAKTEAEVSSEDAQEQVMTSEENSSVEADEITAQNALATETGIAEEQPLAEVQTETVAEDNEATAEQSVTQKESDITEVNDETEQSIKDQETPEAEQNLEQNGQNTSEVGSDETEENQSDDQLEQEITAETLTNLATGNTDISEKLTRLASLVSETDQQNDEPITSNEEQLSQLNNSEKTALFE